MEQETDSVPKCPWCGTSHPNTICHMVKSIEYFGNGRIKKVDFKVASDYQALLPQFTGPTYPQSIPNNPSFGTIGSTTTTTMPLTLVSGSGVVAVGGSTTNTSQKT